MIKTRFAPSPTGIMHIGSIRTALYAFLVARQNKGSFSLRIEDTDRKRLIPEAINDITESLRWLGLNFDGEPIVQSTRQEIYQSHARRLVEKGAAYEKEGAIWFKMPLKGQIKFTDLIGNRKVVFNLAEQKDFVLLKSDGLPTYHLAHVVDDHLMETSPIIRGDEWLPSVPKHILTFQAFGWEIPQYAHLPLIMGTDRSKLSKRHGAKGVSEFRQDGFLPQAILNHMALLGWTPPDGQEIISLEQMIKIFNLKNVHSAPAVFDIVKLEWMNGEYIRKSQNSNLKDQIWEYLQYISKGQLGKKGHPTKEDIEKVIPLIQERIKKLSDFILLTDFLWKKAEYDKSQFQKVKIKDRRGLFSQEFENQKDVLGKILEKLETMEKPWKTEVFEKTFRDLAENLGVKTGDVFQLIRVAISGQTVTPPLFGSIQILGEEETISRIKAGLKFLSAQIVLPL